MPEHEFRCPLRIVLIINFRAEDFWKQRYFCHTCQRSSREDPQPNGYTQEQREEILRAYEERSSLRGLTRTFGVARNSVSQWLREKKRPSRS